MTESPMDRALALARQARGSTRPNPPVGAVLVKDGRIVGEGFTQPAGGAHAEIMALAAAGEQATGADLYVTLEPCSHWGRTPPCADALVAARIACAHIALLDPNPLVNGSGAARLRDHGIPVEIGEGADAAANLIEAHATRMRLRRPFVTLALGVRDTCLEEVGRDADALLFAGPVPKTWSSAAYSLAFGRGDAEATLVRPGELSLPRALGGANLRDLLSSFGDAGVSSMLADETLRDSLLEERLVDKVVAGPQAVVPDGFALRPGAQSVPGCCVYYPELR